MLHRRNELCTGKRKKFQWHALAKTLTKRTVWARKWKYGHEFRWFLQSKNLRKYLPITFLHCHSSLMAKLHEYIQTANTAPSNGKKLCWQTCSLKKDNYLLADSFQSLRFLHGVLRLKTSTVFHANKKFI